MRNVPGGGDWIAARSLGQIITFTRDPEQARRTQNACDDGAADFAASIVLRRFRLSI
jgi:hypothetical protein